MSEMSNIEETKKYVSKITDDLLEILFDKGFLVDNISKKGLDIMKEYITYHLTMEIDLEIQRRQLIKVERKFEARESLEAHSRQEV